MGTIYIKSKFGITHFALHITTRNLTCRLQTKAFKNFSSERDLNPRPSDYKGWVSFIYYIVDNKMFLLSMRLRDRCPYRYISTCVPR